MTGDRSIEIFYISALLNYIDFNPYGEIELNTEKFIRELEYFRRKDNGWNTKTGIHSHITETIDAVRLLSLRHRTDQRAIRFIKNNYYDHDCLTLSYVALMYAYLYSSGHKKYRDEAKDMINKLSDLDYGDISTSDLLSVVQNTVCIAIMVGETYEDYVEELTYELMDRYEEYEDEDRDGEEIEDETDIGGTMRDEILATIRFISSMYDIGDCQEFISGLSDTYDKRSKFIDEELLFIKLSRLYPLKNVFKDVDRGLLESIQKKLVDRFNNLEYVIAAKCASVLSGSDSYIGEELNRVYDALNLFQNPDGGWGHIYFASCPDCSCYPALVMIKAYEKTRNRKYLDIAIKAIDMIGDEENLRFLVRADLYVKALLMLYKITEDIGFLERAESFIEDISVDIDAIKDKNDEEKSKFLGCLTHIIGAYCHLYLERKDDKFMDKIKEYSDLLRVILRVMPLLYEPHEILDTFSLVWKTTGEESIYNYAREFARFNIPYDLTINDYVDVIIYWNTGRRDDMPDRGVMERFIDLEDINSADVAFLALCYELDSEI